MSNQPVRVAVVGAGAMGRNHLRIYSSLKGVELVGLVDADDDRARAVAATFDCPVLGSLADVVGVAEAASVTAPSSMHRDIGCELLGQGVHCLVEKPLATTPEEARELIDAADRSGAVLLVGHVERFNPAVRQLKRILAGGHRVAAIDARRMNSVSSRITDVDVVVDLMVHDLDIVLDLLGEEVVEVVARGVHVDEAMGEDYVTAMLTFPNGALASLTASRITQHKIRSLQVTTDRNLISVEYGSQELTIFRQGTLVPTVESALSEGEYVLELQAERVFVRNEEPLACELAHFMEAVRGKVAPIVTGRHALAGLLVMQRIQDDVRRDRSAAS